MASLPESSTFDAGVYQLELTDPVIGGPSGVSNTPLKNLANRTKYLKDHVDALESSRAPLASPALTGTPTAPTASQGTNTTQLATTAFVQAEIAADMAANLAAASPLMDGTAAVGVATKMAREDHRHPTDTTRAPLASPAFTGTPTAPTPATNDNSTKLATTAFVKGAIDSIQVTDAGLVSYFAATAAPSGWIKANGAAVSRATYAALFAAIGTTYGAGDGLTTFNLPDLRGEFLRGFDDGRGVDGGRTIGSFQQATSSAQGQCGNSTTRVESGNVDAYVLTQGVASFGGMFTENSTYYRHRPRNIALLACIKY